MNQSNNLPQKVQEALKLVTQLFDQRQIKYWLGGGLFQLIIQNRYAAITRDYKAHDIDLHILDSQSVSAFEALKACEDIKDLDIYPSGYRNVKIAFKIGVLKIETPFLFESPDDTNVLFYISWGKKEDWLLTENERQRFYYFSFPKEIFSEDTIELGDLKIRIPKKEYVKILYK